ncbi:MAG: DUF116 domain-containing protein [Bacillota bacterium]
MMEMGKAKKRIYISLLLISIAILAALATAGVSLYFNRFTRFYKWTLFAILVILTALIVLLSLGLAATVLTLWHVKGFFGLERLINFSVNLLFPITVALGRVFHIPKDLIKSSYIEVNNNLVKAKNYRLKPADVLILAPHCLQRWDCPYKITADVKNCRRCGRCDISKLIALAEERGVHMAVATGGTLARKIVMDLRPKAIVAIACERDLSEGILDTNPIPVLGILNIRPEGPCVNTKVDVKKVKEALEFFLMGREKELKADEEQEPAISCSENTN